MAKNSPTILRTSLAIIGFMRVSILLSLTFLISSGVRPSSAADAATFKSESKVPQTRVVNSNDLIAATRLYQAANYQASSKYVESYLRSDSKSVAARYLLANCLLALNQLPQASHEYSIVLHLNPKSQFADNARKAIKQIEAAQIAKAAMIETNRAASDADSEDQEEQVGDGTINGAKTVTVKPKVAPKHIPAGTLELIRMQTAKARELAVQAGQTEAANEKHKADIQGRSEQEQIERLVNTTGSRGDQQATSGGDLAVLRSRAAQNAESLRQLGEAKAAWKEREAREKSEGLQRQAEELEEQLINNDKDYKGRTVKLNPVGTNLYIRNYSSAKPLVRSLDAQQRMLPAITDEVSTSARVGTTGVGQRAKSGKTSAAVRGDGAKRTETKLEGEVLPR